MKKRIAVGDFRIEEEERKAINDVLDLGRISEWKKTKEFESKFAEYVGVKFSVAVSSGTAALLVGLLALQYDERFKRIQKGTKIITSPVTYASTTNAIILSGFEPVFVDIYPETFALIPEKVEEALLEHGPDNFSIILPVHLMGYPNDMDKLNALAEKYGLITFEDSAQAHGSTYKGKKTGSLSLLADFSFYIAHNIQAGEMGAITTNDNVLYALIKRIKSNGRRCDCHYCTRANGLCPRQNDEDDPRFMHDYVAYNFKIMEFQAALAIAQLKRADEIFKKRLENVQYLNNKLEKFRHLFRLPQASSNVSNLAYPLVIEDKKLNRRNVMRELESEGVETRPLFGCIPTQQPAFSFLKAKYEGKLPVAEDIGANGLYIGCHQYLSIHDLDYVVSVFDKLFKGH